MIIFGTLGLSIVFMLLGMILTGTWPNFFKYKEHETRKEHLFLSYSLSAFIVALIAAFTLGSYGSAQPDFVDNLHSASSLRVLAAVAGGICISLCYLFKVFAIELCGLAIASPTSSGIAIIGGTLLNHAIVPVARFWLLMVGVVLVVIALIFESAAVIQKQKTQTTGSVIELAKLDELADQNLHRATSAEASCEREEVRKTVVARLNKKGIALGVISGIFGCLWAPLSTYSMQHKGREGTLSAYTSFFYVMMGAMLAGIIGCKYFLRRPIVDKPAVPLRSFFHLGWRVYLLGTCAGIMMALGNLFSFVAGQSSGDYVVSFAIARANPLVSALYGVILWKDFNNTDLLTKALFACCILFYLGGILAIAFCA